MMVAKGRNIILAILVITGWFALITQFYLIINNRIASIGETIARYFGFFTILTNIIVAVCCIVLLFKPASGPGNFFSKANTQTAITVYITVVGFVYNIILRFLWKPEGLQMIVDELLHTVIPLLFIVQWYVYAPKQGLKWKNIFPWLLYPLFYLIYTLLRGSFSGFYPYPFINVNELGYNKVWVNCIGLLLFFLLLSLLFVAIAKLLVRRK